MNLLTRISANKQLFIFIGYVLLVIISINFAIGYETEPLENVANESIDYLLNFEYDNDVVLTDGEPALRQATMEQIGILFSDQQYFEFKKATKYMHEIHVQLTVHYSGNQRLIVQKAIYQVYNDVVKLWRAAGDEQPVIIYCTDHNNNELILLCVDAVWAKQFKN